MRDGGETQYSRYKAQFKRRSAASSRTSKFESCLADSHCVARSGGTLFVVVASALIATGCSYLRPPFGSPSKVVNSTLTLPPPVHATLARKGFTPLAPHEARRPQRAYWCVRPVNIPGGRIAAALGWYHEWILMPGMEMGADFEGADSVRGTWPPSPKAFFVPLRANDHTGAAAGQETYCRPIEGVKTEALCQSAYATPRAGPFPFPMSNCNTWVRKVIKKARLAQGGMAE